MRIVLKFGGSSLADTQKIYAAAEKAASFYRQGYQTVVVVSAQGDTTDDMMDAITQVHPHAPMREMDAFLSAGEQMSAALMAMALNRLGLPAVSLTGVQAGILTDGVHGNAQVLGLSNQRIVQELETGKIVVVAGFQGVNGSADITTLGRGGSDTTAVALAAFLQAQQCLIYTDVDGIYDKDPRKHSDAVRMQHIGYDDMLQMARQGAQVLHDRSVELAQRYLVPIRVLSSFRPGDGTLVSDFPEDSFQNG